jgi:hypothetical protein
MNMWSAVIAASWKCIPEHNKDFMLNTCVPMSFVRVGLRGKPTEHLPGITSATLTSVFFLAHISVR